MSELPTPIKGAQTRAEIALNIFDTITSFVSAPPIGALAASIMNKRIEHAQNLLKERVAAGEISLLSAEQFEELIPIGYKFIEASKQGEQKYVLKLLAQIISEKVKTKTLDSREFLNVARRIEGFGKDELTALVKIFHRFQEQGFKKKLSKTELLEVIILDQSDLTDLILSDFASRGLIISSPSETMDDIGPNYSLSPALEEIIVSAIKIQEEED